MKRMISLACTFLATAAMLFSCTEDITQTPMDANTSPETRVGNPAKVMVYIETNDVNPLNALTYVKPDGTPFIDFLNIFAANINRDSSGNPTVYFNPELAPIMNNYNTDIRPLQDAGIKVNLSLLPNHQQIGYANLTGNWDDPNSQVRKFARLVAYVICSYGFDGINCDDEYAEYPSLVSGSFGNFIKALRAEFDLHCPDKMITVFQWGNVGQIDSTAAAMIDYSDNGNYSYATFNNNRISGVPNSKFMPVSLNLGAPMPSYYNTVQLTTIWANARRVVAQGYAGAMGFNLRDNGSALPVFQKWAQGFAGVNSGTYVTWNGTNYPQRTPFIYGGHTITFADVPANF